MPPQDCFFYIADPFAIPASLIIPESRWHECWTLRSRCNLWSRSRHAMYSINLWWYPAQNCLSTNKKFFFLRKHCMRRTLLKCHHIPGYAHRPPTEAWAPDSRCYIKSEVRSPASLRDSSSFCATFKTYAVLCDSGTPCWHLKMLLCMAAPNHANSLAWNTW